MKNTLRLLILLLSISALGSCRVKPATTASKTATYSFVLADSAMAANRIVQDSMDGFFERITEIELRIQLKNGAKDKNRADLLDMLKQEMRQSVRGFTAAESKKLSEIMRQCLDVCAQMNPNWKLPEIVMVKISGEHYGLGVYYTRENCIMVPEDALERMDRGFKSTMLHEIFHVLSRYNPELRYQLYATVGFKKLNEAPQLAPALKARQLHNPDGVDVGYAIKVALSPTDTVDVIPVIFSKKAEYTGDMAFFQYLEFGFLPLRAGKMDVKDLILDEQKLLNFRTQITQNTDYIIHPDEILADNFSFLLMSKLGEDKLSRFDAAGQALIAKIEKILKDEK